MAKKDEIKTLLDGIAENFKKLYETEITKSADTKEDTKVDKSAETHKEGEDNKDMAKDINVDELKKSLMETVTKEIQDKLTKKEEELNKTIDTKLETISKSIVESIVNVVKDTVEKVKEELSKSIEEMKAEIDTTKAEIEKIENAPTIKKSLDSAGSNSPKDDDLEKKAKEEKMQKIIKAIDAFQSEVTPEDVIAFETMGKVSPKLEELAARLSK